ncbi:hypothetical protein Tco_0488192 [Tanacetum coccineum]
MRAPDHPSPTPSYHTQRPRTLPHLLYLHHHRLTRFRLRQTMSQLQTLRPSCLRHRHHLTMHRVWILRLSLLRRTLRRLSMTQSRIPQRRSFRGGSDRGGRATIGSGPTYITLSYRTYHTYFDIQPRRIPSFPPYRLHPNGSSFMFTLRNSVRAPYAFSPSIEAAITEEIIAPHRKRTRSPSPPPSPLLPPSPSSSSSLPPPPRDTLPPRNRFRMTLPHPDTTDDAMVETTAPHRRMAHHEREIHALQDQIEEVSLTRLDSMLDRDATLDALELARGLITYLESRLEESEAREAVLERCIGSFEERFGPPDKNCQVKYAMCTLLDGALTWWNSYVQSVGLDAACETTWKELKQMMTEEYSLRNEGLADDIQGNGTSSKPTKIQESICMAHDLMDQVVQSKAAKGVDNKRK